MNKYKPVANEAPAVAHMAKQIRDEEDERVLAKLNDLLGQGDEGESFTAKLALVGGHPTTVDSMLMSEADYQDITLDGAVDTNPHSMVTEDMRREWGAVSERMSQAAAQFNLKVLRAAAESLHNTSVPLEEAKRRMMEAMEKLTPADIPVVQRELQKMLVKNGPARPVNRAQRRQVKKARRRA